MALFDPDLQFLQPLCRDDAPPSSDSSDSEGPPFPEKDEARQNYSQETIRSQHLAAELEVAQSDRAVVQAQFSAADSRVACKSPSSRNASLSPSDLSSLTCSSCDTLGVCTVELYLFYASCA